MTMMFSADLSADDPTSTVELSFSCRELMDKDVFSRSDPFVVIYKSLKGSNEWIEIQRTETCQDELNPVFSRKLVIDYRFEEEQPMRFEVYDRDSDSEDLGNHSFLGFAECNLSQIVSSVNGFEMNLSLNRNTVYFPSKAPKICRGRIFILAEELHELKQGVTIEVWGSDLGSSMFACLLPVRVFFTLSKETECETGSILLYRSEAVPGPCPKFQELKTTMQGLCGGDRERALHLQFFQQGFNGYHTDLGSLVTSVDRLEAAASSSTPLTLVSSKTGKEKNSRITIAKFKLEPIYTFVEYIQKGTQIHTYFGIDFTTSNLDPNDPNSLHHFSQFEEDTKSNPYEQAITAVGEIIQDYSIDKKFPVYGFGAKLSPKQEVSHKFYVTLGSDPNCSGIGGILQAYKECIRKVELGTPTNFAPIIEEVASEAAKNQMGRHYYILLMITDGRIDDMELTKEAIVNASDLPLSIIIVGVGNANFNAMTVLDGDIVRLSSNGRYATRDIVQFIPFRDSHSWMQAVCPEVIGSWSSSVDGTNRMAKMKLAQEVLAEIPEQLTSYMKSKGIVPGKVS